MTSRSYCIILTSATMKSLLVDPQDPYPAGSINYGFADSLR